MHLYDAIEEYNFEHGKHFDAVTGQYDLLMPHDLGRPLTHEEMDYNFLYQKQTMNGFRIFGSGVNYRLNTDDTDKVLKFHQIDPLDDNYNLYTAAGYVTGQWIWIPEEVNVVVVTYISLVANPTSINETSLNTTTFTLTTLNATDGTTIDWSIAATGGITANDFIGGQLTGTATITNNTATWTVAAAQDAFTEGTETFTLTLASIDSQGNDTTTLNGSPLSAQVQILDSSMTPAYISLVGDASTVAEGGSITYTVNTQNFFQAATATWGIDFGSSTANAADFATSSGTVNIDANGNGQFTVTTVSDFLVEGSETFVVRIAGPDSNGIPTNISATGTITNVTFPTYTSFNGPLTRLEGQTATYVLNGTDIPNGTTVGYTITGVDVTDISLPNLTGTITMNNFMGNQQAGQLQFSILEDYIVESAEDMVITLNGADSAGNTTGLPMSITTTITDVAPTYTIDGASQIVEGETQTYTFKATNMNPGTTVYWELRNYASGDYVDFTNDIVSPRTGNGQVVQVGNEVHLTFDIEVSNDYINAEGDEYLKIVVWDDAANYDTASPNFDTAVSGALATKDITVVDLAPEWQLTTASNNQAEPEVLTFDILTRYVPVGTPFTWEAKAYGANPAAAADFDGGVFPSGSGTVSTFNNTITLDSQFTTSVIADNTTENDPEQYILELSDANGVVASKIINITDNSQTPPPIVYSMAVSPLSIVEDTNAQYMEFTLTATQANGNIPPAGTTIGYTIDGEWDINDIEVIGVVGAGNHASEPFPTIVSGPANPYTEVFKLDTNGQAAIRVYGTYDQLVENGEDVTVTVDANDSAGNATGGVSATGTINDAAAQVWQISTSNTHTEGTILPVNIQTQNVPPQAFSWQIVAGASSPAQANDFDPVGFPSGSGNITTNNATLTTDATFNVTTAIDALVDPGEIYTINLYDANGVLVDSHDVTIVDITQTFDCTDAGLTINPGITGQAVTGSVANGTITGQFNPSTYQSGNQSYTVSITAPPVDINNNPYSNAGQNISCSANAAGTNPTFALTNNGPVSEGSPITWTLTTTNVANGVTVPFTLSGSASSPQDYQNVQPFEFTVNNNTATYTVNTFADSLTELGAETVIVTLDANDSAGNATGSIASTATINDTSLTPTYNTITAQTVNEGQNMTFTLSTANVANGTTVGFTFTGTAASGTDYTLPGPAQMTINNNSATYTITTIADQVTENASETVIMTLNATDSNGYGTNSISGTGTINDTSQAPVFDCADAGLSVADGTVGQAVSATVTNGVIASISPATYQLGTTTYTAQITAPAADGNGVAYDNAGQNIPCSDTATGNAVLENMYWIHWGNGAFPYAQDLEGSGPFYYEATGGVGGPGVGEESSIQPILQDMIDNPSQWTVFVPGDSQTTMQVGDTFSFPAAAAGSFYYLVIPDSYGIPDLTQVNKISENGGPAGAAASKLSLTLNGNPYTMYKLTAAASTATLTAEYQ